MQIPPSPFSIDKRLSFNPQSITRPLDQVLDCVTLTPTYAYTFFITTPLFSRIPHKEVSISKMSLFLPNDSRNSSKTLEECSTSGERQETRSFFGRRPRHARMFGMIAPAPAILRNRKWILRQADKDGHYTRRRKPREMSAASPFSGSTFRSNGSSRFEFIGD